MADSFGTFLRALYKPRDKQPQAWICPRCGTVNAWWRASCSCKPEGAA